MHSIDAIFTTITEIIKRSGTAQAVFPATHIFNEGWMLALVLEWIYSHPLVDFPIVFHKTSRWYSEALLSSPFLSEYKGDPLGEAYTHADGVIGEFSIGDKGKGDLALSKGTQQFLVLEAKIFSSLSKGVTHASNYDQAARNVACISKVLMDANLPPDSLEQLGFYVVAPKQAIEEGTFGSLMTKASIAQKVQQRVEAYESHPGRSRSSWHTAWFQPVLNRMNIDLISWEFLLEKVIQSDPIYGKQLQAFYALCLEYNERSNVNQRG